MKIKKGDLVQVITGKDKGKQGKVITAFPVRTASWSRVSTGSRSTPRPARRRPVASSRPRPLST